MNIQSNFDTVNRLRSVYEKLINTPVNVIFEFGARYCEDTLEFEKLYPDAKIFSFECNPTTLPVCRARVLDKRQITLIESAIGNHDGTVKFYPINKEKTKTDWEDGNQGASSLFKASGNYKIEEYHQDEIEVPITKADTFIKSHNINAVDILWMDIQGAELMALEGFGKELEKVKLIQTEVEFMEIYSGQPLFSDIDTFLKSNGFTFLGFSTKNHHFGDAIFINSSLLTFKKKLFWFWFNPLKKN
jgi:FkbM family methyltransferase